MKRLLIVLLSFVLIVTIVTAANAQSFTVIWQDKIETDDIALSKDGRNVAVAEFIPSGFGSEGTGRVRFYGRSSVIPIWTSSISEGLWGITISADGNSIAARGDAHVFFWTNARSLTGNPPPTWVSADVKDPVLRRCVDISDDGNFLAACGDGGIFYWSNALSNTGTNVPASWSSSTGALAIDLSNSGDFLVAGVGKTVAYWKNVKALSGNPPPAWQSTKPADLVVDVAVSADGNFVVAAVESDRIHYWAGAKSLSGDPSATWDGGVTASFTSIDMSSDGGSVVAGAYKTDPTVYFWGAATGLSGTPSPTWAFATGSMVLDVVITGSGDAVVALNDLPTRSVYFLNRFGVMQWSQQLDFPGEELSISSDGSTLAVGTQGLGTSYLFSTGFVPVGGYVSSEDKLGILTPYLALVGLVGLVVVLVLIKRYRRD